MPSKHTINGLISTSSSFFLFLTILSQLPHTSLSDGVPLGECPYPCLPPPIPTTNNYPSPPGSVAYQSPPPPSFQSQLPPGMGYIYPPPPPSGGYVPVYRPPYNGGPAPPPPNPILPYFPFYYKSPPGSDSPRNSGVMMWSVLLHLCFLAFVLC